MPAKKDQQERILQLCGDEYTVLDAPDGFCSTKRMKLRHNICGVEWRIKIGNFFNGRRCPNKECIQDRRNQTNLQRYGAESPMQREEIQSKIKKTNLQRYGVECNLQIKEVQEKVKQTNVQRYGTEYPLQSFQIQEKTKQITLQKYGVEKPLQNKDIQEKSKQTILEKYGTEYVLQNKEIKQKIQKRRFEVFYNNLQNKFPLLEPCFAQGEYSGIRGGLYRFRCKECGYEFERTIHCNIPVCRKCNPPLRGTSKQEAEVREFISSIVGSSISSNVRSVIPPQELDIYSEQRRVGVEFNGIYWHSEEFVDKKYHSEKSKLAREAGIKLFHIFSDEWEQKQDIVKSMLSHAFGVTQRKLFARKCSIAEVSTRDAKHFFESTHISGGGRSKSAFGLFYDGKLVSCLSLGVPIKNKRYSNCIEIVRFANQLNTHVVGGFSKLLAAAKRWSLENGFENILSYADLRFGDGNVYRKNGFEYLGDTDVNYWYTDGLNRYSRQSFRARDGKTERQIAEESGVFKIYGCGHAIFMLNIEK